MASLDELRAAIAQARTELVRAAGGAGGPTWEQARAPESSGEEGWAPREAAEHAIGADVGFARAVAEAVGFESPARPSIELVTADAAAGASADAAKLADTVYGALEPSHLGLETRFAGNVEGVLELAARHLQEHADQIAADR